MSIETKARLEFFYNHKIRLAVIWLVQNMKFFAPSQRTQSNKYIPRTEDIELGIDLRHSLHTQRDDYFGDNLWNLLCGCSTYSGYMKWRGYIRDIIHNPRKTYTGYTDENYPIQSYRGCHARALPGEVSQVRLRKNPSPLRILCIITRVIDLLRAELRRKTYDTNIHLAIAPFLNATVSSKP